MPPVASLTKQDPLFDLIKSLSKAEKRNFKLYALRQSGNADAKFVSLFDAMDGLDEYDEARILKKCPVKKEQLPNMKAHLYRQILVSCRLIHVQHNVSIQLREQIDFARILYDKGLYRQSLKILDKAKSIALAAQQSTIALEIIEFEKNIETLHITRSMGNRADQLSRETIEMCNKLENNNDLSNLSIQIYSLYLKLGHIRSQKDLKLVTQIFEPKIARYEGRELTFMEQLYLYQAKMWYSYIRHDFLYCYKYARLVVDLFHEQPRMKSLLYDHYLKGFSRLLETLFMLRDYKRFSATLADFERIAREMEETNEHAVILSGLVLYFNRINLHFMEGTFHEGVYLVDLIEEYLHKYSNIIDPHYKMLYYYKIACLYFGDGQYTKCIEFLQRIITIRDSKIRRDLQCFARMLNLIASYEAGQDYNLDYQIRSVYSFIVKMNDMHAVQKEIIAFLKKLNNIYASEVKGELRALYDRLLPYASHPYERRPFFYLDLISWLESKIRNVPVSTVIQEKFRESREKAAASALPAKP